MSAELTLDDIRSSVLAEYFLPLLKHELTVTLDDGNSEVTIDGSAAIAHATEVAAPLLRERISLGERITSGNTYAVDWPQRFRYDATDWDGVGLPEGYLDQLRDVLESGEALSVRVAIEVKKKGSTQSDPGYLTIHVRRIDGLGATRPLIVRDGISISEEKTKSLHDHVAIVTVDACALAALVGDAETPAHERLQHELIKDRYVYPRKMIGFVREAAANMLRVIWHVDQDDDPFALASFFPLLSADGRPAKRARRGDRGPEPEPEPKPEIPKRPRRFGISKIDGGVRVAGVGGALPPPEEIHLALAYDVRRGNPFKRYRPLDFHLAEPPIEIAVEKGEIIALDANKLTMRPSANDFAVTVIGFDRRRDVIVRATATGGQP